MFDFLVTINLQWIGNSVWFIFVLVDKKSNSLEAGRKKSGPGEASSYGSLPRRGDINSSSLKRNGSERGSFYKVENDISNLESFHPVTITVSSFFKQASHVD